MKKPLIIFGAIISVLIIILSLFPIDPANKLLEWLFIIFCTVGIALVLFGIGLIPIAVLVLVISLIIKSEKVKAGISILRRIFVKLFEYGVISLLVASLFKAIPWLIGIFR
ncbi:hypothetical protein L6279_00985 [Candidatus Parcubacteria bacterium]|nr:hypothetical protein [Patescibacteria group bacterium]MBU4467074.1 hypothetical protein [Patescibacteria group bacterium]MCG2688769.1 hypothetical protein [Candidatus Parcubacteria bacterium]MCG2692670.1 hypothetical protein [Candidatus Parcubacteria bacterium]